jgi:hypothetical protein
MNIKISVAKIIFILKRLSKRIWVRAFLYALVGILIAIFALFAKNIFPEEISINITTTAAGHSEYLRRA